MPNARHRADRRLYGCLVADGVRPPFRIGLAAG
jgi:hypothetical protein